MNDLISIILPVYNRAHVLPDCVTSILSQTHQNYEVLLIDDGSTDATPQLCQSYVQADPRFRLIRGTHNGVSAARNLGLEAAKGDFLFFVDSDDAIHPHLLETLVQAMLHTDAQMGGTPDARVQHERWYRVSEHIAATPGPGSTQLLDHKGAIDAAFTPGTPLRAFGGIMLRRDHLGDTRFRPDLSIGEDFYFIYENLIKGACVVLVQQRWYYRRFHPANASRDFSLTGFDSRFLRRQLVWTSEDALGRRENARQQKQEAFSIFLNHLNQGVMSKADQKQMCRTVRAHRKELLPALTFKDRLQYHIFTHFPGLFSLTRIFRRKK